MDRDFLIDLFSDFGPVTIRPMFSGFGISADGINFAMALRAGLYFRADEATIAQFEAVRRRLQEHGRDRKDFLLELLAGEMDASRQVDGGAARDRSPTHRDRAGVAVGAAAVAPRCAQVVDAYGRIVTQCY